MEDWNQKPRPRPLVSSRMFAKNVPCSGIITYTHPKTMSSPGDARKSVQVSSASRHGSHALRGNFGDSGRSSFLDFASNACPSCSCRTPVPKPRPVRVLHAGSTSIGIQMNPVISALKHIIIIICVWVDGDSHILRYSEVFMLGLATGQPITPCVKISVAERPKLIV